MQRFRTEQSRLYREQEVYGYCSSLLAFLRVLTAPSFYAYRDLASSERTLSVTSDRLHVSDAEERTAADERIACKPQASPLIARTSSERCLAFGSNSFRSTCTPSATPSAVCTRPSSCHLSCCCHPDFETTHKPRSIIL